MARILKKGRNQLGQEEKGHFRYWAFLILLASPLIFLPRKKWRKLETVGTKSPYSGLKMYLVLFLFPSYSPHLRF